METSDLKPLQRQCLLACLNDRDQTLMRTRGGFATADRTQIFTTRTVFGLDAAGLLRLAGQFNSHAELTAPGKRLAEELHAIGQSKAVAL